MDQMFETIKKKIDTTTSVELPVVIQKKKHYRASQSPEVPETQAH